jgi:hypothetical protein
MSSSELLLRGEIITLSESLPGDGIKVYTVTFLDVMPTKRAVEEAVSMLEMFADITWPFQLHADMRQGQLKEQLKYLGTYGTLISKIANENCKGCLVRLPPSAGAGRKILVKSITFIVEMLGVECRIE